MHLSKQTQAAIQYGEILAERDAALLTLMSVLDPDGNHSSWWLAGAISERVRRFESTAWPRIHAGHREPRDRLETALATCCECCPRSQGKLHPILQELRDSAQLGEKLSDSI